MARAGSAREDYLGVAPRVARRREEVVVVAVVARRRRVVRPLVVERGARVPDPAAADVVAARHDGPAARRGVVEDAAAERARRERGVVAVPETALRRNKEAIRPRR